MRVDESQAVRAQGRDLQAIVGVENVLDEPGILEDLSFDCSFIPGARPSFVVRPGTAKEVQETVRWANAAGRPLVPVSSGPPHFRGDTVPAVPGSVILDLSRMKRILKVDPANWVALVEPGVTFAELQAELRAAGLTVYMPLAPRAGKSVVGSILEREPITQPVYHWDSLDPMLCVEMVLGTGDFLRTGEAAGPDTLEGQWEVGKAQLNPFGPGQYDQNRLISGAQGTIGVVTWASVKCRPLADLTRAFLVPAATLEPLIEISYDMVHARLGNHLFIVNALNLACLTARDATEVVALARSLPPWILVATFEASGPLAVDKLDYQEADFRDIVAARGVEPYVSLAGVDAADVHAALGRPSAEPYWKVKYKGAVQELFFQNTLDRSPTFVETVTASAEAAGFSPEDVGVYLQMMVQGTSCHCEFDFYYAPEDEAAVNRARAVMALSSADAAGAGAFFSRPYGPWTELAYAEASGTRILQRKLKTIFDPNEILNPGRLCFQEVER